VAQFRSLRHSGESPEGIPLEPESKFIVYPSLWMPAFHEVIPSGRWHDNGSQVWCSQTESVPEFEFQYKSDDIPFAVSFALINQSNYFRKTKE
jgi:hypothetical protein